MLRHPHLGGLSSFEKPDGFFCDLTTKSVFDESHHPHPWNASENEKPRVIAGFSTGSQPFEIPFSNLDLQSIANAPVDFLPAISDNTEEPGAPW